MQILESFYIAIQSIVSNKLRSALTLLGIAIGLFSIIIVMTAISAIQHSFEDVFNSIGTNNLVIQKYPAIRMGHGSWRKYRNRKDITIEQGKKLKKMTKLPKAVGMYLSKSLSVVKYGNKSTNKDVDLVGMNFDAQITNDRVVEIGRGLSKQDDEYARPVCILGADVVKKIFPSIYPIGETVKINNLNFTVVGVYEKKGSVLGQGQDNFVAIPLSVFAKYYGKHRTVSLIVMAESKELFEKTKDEVIGALRTIRKVPPHKDNDFEILTNDQLIDQFNDITKYFKIGAAVIAFIALVAAGVGIMNIMLVSVTERTREIGIRKALGAKKKIIRIQFVFEAIALSQVGGLFGIVFGVIGGNLVAINLGVNVIVPIDWIFIGLFITTFVGLVFGVYPAVKASNLDPIEALRYE